MSGNTKSGRIGKRQKEAEEKQNKVGLDWVCPDWLNKEAKLYWEKTLPRLIEFGFLSDADQEAFARLCNLQSEYKQATKEIEKKGLTIETVGYKKQVKILRNPAFDMKAKLLTPLKDLESRFGLTPGDREKIKIKKQSAKKIGVRDKYQR